MSGRRQPVATPSQMDERSAARSQASVTRGLHSPATLANTFADLPAQDVTKDSLLASFVGRSLSSVSAFIRTQLQTHSEATQELGQLAALSDNSEIRTSLIALAEKHHGVFTAVLPPLVANTNNAQAPSTPAADILTAAVSARIRRIIRYYYLTTVGLY